MENNEKTPREPSSGEQNNSGKKPYHKYNHRRRQNQNKSSDRPHLSEQDKSGDGISVRGGRYDLPPSEPQKTEITYSQNKQESADGTVGAEHSSRRPRRRRNDRRHDTQSVSAEAAVQSESAHDGVTDADEAAAFEPGTNGTQNNERRRRRSRGGRRHNRDRKPRTDELLAEAEDELALDEGSDADASRRSEYITTAGSLDEEIVDELNSITSADAERMESEEPDEYVPEPPPAAPEVELKKYEVVGIRFKSGGKIYYFDPVEFKFKKGDCAVVETARGLEFGTCELSNRTVTEREVVLPLRTVVRRATADDIARHDANTKQEKAAFDICAQKIVEHKLGMKLIDVEYAFDGSKLLFYFTAEGRVDFRELVKDLAAVFRTRIELRQIGIRDETKLLGGIGICGRPFCCKTFLSDFVQVSIKMAKEQNLSLNSVKISGACGRLMCCLRYEYDTYQEEIKKTPKVDQIVSTPDGDGTVIEVQPLAGLIRVRFGTKADMITPKVYHRDEVKVIGGKGVKPKEQPTAE